MGIKKPPYLLALLTDTLDSDPFPRASESEIRLNDPRFQDGAILNETALSRILETYRVQTGDRNTTSEPFTEVFGFTGAPLDINYATVEQLRLLYPDLPHYVLVRLARHDAYYDKPETLPFSKTVIKRLTHPAAGTEITFQTRYVSVSFSLSDKADCRIEGSFRLEIGKRHTIDQVTLQPPICSQEEEEKSD